jgi:hypothetical protein
VGDLSVLEGVAQGAHDHVLAHQILETLRAPAAREHLIRGHALLRVPGSGHRAPAAQGEVTPGSGPGPWTPNQGFSSWRSKEPGGTAAPVAFPLSLLPSGPDEVRGAPSRGTRAPCFPRCTSPPYPRHNLTSLFAPPHPLPHPSRVLARPLRRAAHANVLICTSLIARLPMAERAGFEPAVRLPVHTLSKRALSATQTPLRVVHDRSPICRGHTIASVNRLSLSSPRLAAHPHRRESEPTPTRSTTHPTTVGPHPPSPQPLPTASAGVPYLARGNLWRRGWDGGSIARP